MVETLLVEKGVLGGEEEKKPESHEESSLSLFEKLLEKHSEYSGSESLPPKTQGGGDNTTPAPLPSEELQDTPWKALPLSECLESEHWKYKLHGLQCLQELLGLEPKAKKDGPLELSTEQIAQYASTLANSPLETNSNLQRAFLEVMAALVTHLDHPHVEHLWVHSRLYEFLCDKVFTQPRLLSLCTDLLANILQVVGPSCFFCPFFATLESFCGKDGTVSCKGQQAKRVTGVWTCCEKLCRLFGPTVFHWSDWSRLLSPYSTALDSNVKQSIYSFLLQVYSWTLDKNLVTGYLPDKPKAELLRRIQDHVHQESLVPTRTCQKNASTVAKSEKKLQALDEPSPLSETSPLDSFAAIPPVDISKQMSPEQFEKRLNASVKWKEKVETFQDLMQMCDKAKRLKPTVDYGGYISTIQKTVQLEGNISVVVAALRCCASLANALRQHFVNHLRCVGSMAFSKLKDRNRSILASVVSLLTTLLLCGPFDVYVEDITRVIHDKQPHVRDLGLQWLSCVWDHPNQKEPVQRCLPKLIHFVLEAFDDSTAQVRNRSAQVVKMLLEDSHYAKSIQDAIQGFGTQKAQQMHEILLRDQSQPLTPNIFRTSWVSESKPSVVVSKPQPRGVKPMPSERSEPPMDTSPVRDEISIPQLTMDVDTAKNMLEGIILAEPWTTLVQKFQSGSWKDRMEGFVQFTEIFNTISWTKTPKECEAICSWLGHEGLRHFSESNVNVNKAALKTFLDMLDVFTKDCPPSCAGALVEYFHDKLAEAKLKPSIVELFSRLTQYSSPWWMVVYWLMCSAQFRKSTPKVRGEICLWTKDLLLQYGIPSGDISWIVVYAKSVIEDRVTASRNASLNLLAQLYQSQPAIVTKVIGKTQGSSGILDLISRTASTLPGTQQISQLPHETPPLVQDTGPKLPINKKGEASVKKSPLPSTEGLKAHLSPAALQKLSDSQWVTRRDAVLQLQKAVTAEIDAGRLSTQGALHELFILLRHRLQDEPNRTVLRELLVLLQMFGAGLGPQLSKTYARCILSAVFQRLADKNTAIRQTCMETAAVWLRSAGVLQWISCLNASQLLSSSGDEKELLFKILASHDTAAYQDIQLSTSEAQASMKSFLACSMTLCEERHHILRRHVETCLLKLAPVIPPNLIQKAYKQSRGATQEHVQSIVRKCLELATSKVQGHPCVESPLTEVSATKLMTKKRKNNEDINSPSTPLDDFVLKLTGLSLPSCPQKLEHYRKSKWLGIVGNDEITSLMCIWRHFANEKLVHAMLHKNQPTAHVLCAFSFWEKLFTHAETLAILVKPDQDNAPKNYLIDLVVRFLMVRLWDSNPKISSASSSCFSSLLMALAPYATAQDATFLFLSSVLLSSALPCFFERLPLVLKTCSLLKDKLLANVRHCILFCDPQATFQSLMQWTASLTKRALPYILEELSFLCLNRSQDICVDVKKEIPKLFGFLSPNTDPPLKDLTLKVLLGFCSMVDTDSVISVLAQGLLFQGSEKIIAFLRKNATHSAHAEHSTAPPPILHMKHVDSSISTSLNSLATTTETIHPGPLELKNPLADPSSSAHTSTPAPTLNKLSNLNLRNFIAEWTNHVNQHKIEETFASTRNTLSNYFLKYKTREKEALQHDLAEECRRVIEGRLQPNTAHIAYWNGVMRLEDTSSSIHGECLMISDLLRGMNRPDPVSIAQSAQSLCHFLNDKRSLTGHGTMKPSRDFQVIFASELVTVLIFALEFCFDTSKFRDSSEPANEALWNAGFYVTQLANRIFRDKNVLQRISLVQLHDLYRTLIVAMSSHPHWATYEQGPEIARRLNTIIVRDLMTVVIPRNASYLFLMIFDFLLYYHDSLNPSLVLRVHRKIVTKLNAKHGSFPPSREEIPYYLRTLDVALFILKQLEASPTFSSITAMTELPDSSNDEEGSLKFEKLKGQIEILLKEILFSTLIILGPEMAGVYFRDCGILGDDEHLQDHCKTSTLCNSLTFRLNYQMCSRFERLMNTPYSRQLTATVCPALVSQPVLQNIVDGETMSYLSYTHALHHSKCPKEILQTPPLHYPTFSLSFFLSMASKDTRLDLLDYNLAAGWSSRRDTNARSDITPLQELLPAWQKALSEVSRNVTIPLNKSLALQNAKDCLSSGLVHYELVGKYVRRVLSCLPQSTTGVSRDDPTTHPQNGQNNTLRPPIPYS